MEITGPTIWLAGAVIRPAQSPRLSTWESQSAACWRLVGTRLQKTMKTTLHIVFRVLDSGFKGRRKHVLK